MDGQCIKELIKRKGFTFREIAAGLNVREQNLNSMLKSTDVKTGLLENIASIMEVDVIEFYGYSVSDNGIQAHCDPRLLSIIEARDRQLDTCQQQIQKGQEQIDRLLKIIENAGLLQ